MSIEVKDKRDDPRPMIWEESGSGSDEGSHVEPTSSAHSPMAYGGPEPETVDTIQWSMGTALHVSKQQMSFRPPSEVAEDAMSQKLLSFVAYASGSRLRTLIDDGADSSCINLANSKLRLPLNKLEKINLSISGTTGRETSTAYLVPSIRVQIGGVTKRVTNLYAVRMPELDFDLVIGKPFLAKEQPHIDHQHNIVEFLDGRKWHPPLMPGEQLPPPKWAPVRSARVNTNGTALAHEGGAAMSLAAAERRVKLRQGKLYRVQVDLGKLGSDPFSAPEPDFDDDSPLGQMGAELYRLNARQLNFHQMSSEQTTVDLTPQQQRELDDLRSQFADVSLSDGELPHFKDHVRSVGEHEINLFEGAEKRIPHRAPGKMSPDQLAELKAQLDYLISHGFLRPSQSSTASLVFFVPKPSKFTTDARGNQSEQKRWRMVVDYRAVNRETKKDRYPCPDMSAAIDRMTGHQWYSSVDLTKGFWQVPLRESDCSKSAIVTQLGTFEFTVMPFGLTNAPATFNRITQKLFGSDSVHSKYAVAFVDDVGVYSNSWAEHMQHLKAVLNTLRDNHLYANLEKCSLGVRSVKFLGEVISVEGRRPNPARVEAVASWPRPEKFEDVRTFLGLCGYLSPYIVNYSTRVKPLNRVRQGKPGSGGHQPAFKSLWLKEQEGAFVDLKSAITSLPVLRPPQWDQPFYIQHDASEVALGATLLQRDPSPGSQKLLPIAYAGRSLIEAEALWPTHDLELEGLKFGLQRFEGYFGYGQVITIGDHKPLLHIRTQPKLNKRQLRIMDEIAGFNFVQVYWKGERLKYADLISRRPGQFINLGDITSRLRDAGCQHCADEAWEGICKQHQASVTARRKAECNSISLRELKSFEGLALRHEASTKCNPSERKIRALERRAAELFANNTASSGLPPSSDGPTDAPFASFCKSIPALSAELIRAAYEKDPATARIKKGLESTRRNHCKRRYRMDTEGRIFTRSDAHNDPFAASERLVLPRVLKSEHWGADDSIIRAAIQLCHGTSTSGHSGVQSTFERVRKRFFFKEMWPRVERFVGSCHACQYAKHSTGCSQGLSKPLEPPCSVPGADLSSDFTFGLPPAKDPITDCTYEGVQVWICRLSRRVKFIPVNATITAQQCATLYRMKVAADWGQMRSLVSDRDPRFTSGFWKELASALGTDLKMSSPRHPQTDGQSEQMMAWLSIMLRCFCSQEPESWVSFLPDLEFCVNSTPSSSRDSLSPFMIWQGFEPLEAADLVAPHLAARLGGGAAKDHVARQRIAVSRALDSISFAQDASSARVDSHRREVRYAPTDRVVVHRDHLVPIGEAKRFRKAMNLFAGPFEVIEMVGDSAVRISLPGSYKQHNVFHVSGVKRWVSDDVIPDPMPGSDLASEDGTYIVGSIVKSRMSNGSRQWLVSWRGYNRAYNTWEPLSSLCPNGTPTDSLKRYELSRTGSHEALESALHEGKVATSYVKGTPGDIVKSADAFELTYAFEDETITDVAKRVGVPFKSIQNMNKRCIPNLRKNSKLELGTPLRVREASLSCMAMQPLFLVTCNTEQIRKPYSDLMLEPAATLADHRPASAFMAYFRCTLHDSNYDSSVKLSAL